MWKLNNELIRETNEAKEDWMKQKCEEIEEQERDREGTYDLRYHEVKSFDYGKKIRKGMLLIEDNNDKITDKQGILITWQKCV